MEKLQNSQIIQYPDCISSLPLNDDSVFVIKACVFSGQTLRTPNGAQREFCELSLVLQNSLLWLLPPSEAPSLALCVFLGHLFGHSEDLSALLSSVPFEDVVSLVCLDVPLLHFKQVHLTHPLRPTSATRSSKRSLGSPQPWDVLSCAYLQKNFLFLSNTVSFPAVGARPQGNVCVYCSTEACMSN